MKIMNRLSYPQRFIIAIIALALIDLVIDGRAVPSLQTIVAVGFYVVLDALWGINEGQDEQNAHLGQIANELNTIRRDLTRR